MDQKEWYKSRKLYHYKVLQNNMIKCCQSELVSNLMILDLYFYIRYCQVLSHSPLSNLNNVTIINMYNISKF